MSVRGARLGDTLIARGALTAEGLREALALQERLGSRLGTNLLELRLVSETVLLDTLGQLRETRTVTGDALRDVPPDVLRLVPPRIAERYALIPIEKRGNTLIIASRDPVDVLLEDELGALASCFVRTVVALELRILQALERHYRVPQPVRLTAMVRRLGGSFGTTTRPSSEGGAPESQVVTPDPGANAAISPAAVATLGVTSDAAVESQPVEVPPVESPPVEVPPVEVPPVEAQPVEAHPVAKALDAQATPAKGLVEVAEDDDDAWLQEIFEPSGESEAVPADVVSEVASALPSRVAARTETVSPPVTAAPAAPVSPRQPAAAQPVLPRPNGVMAGRFIELDDEDRALLYPAAPRVLAPKERLRAASEALQGAEIRDDIAQAVLGFCTPAFERSVLLAVRKEQVVGWYGVGEGLSPRAIRSIALSTEAPSTFQQLLHGAPSWRGRLPAFPALEPLREVLTGDADCLVVPIRLRDRVVSFLYLDNGTRGVSGTSLTLLERLAAKAGVAFQVVILKNRIRVL